MSLSETIASAFIRALTDDLAQEGLNSPAELAAFLLDAGRGGIEDRLKGIAQSERFCKSFEGVDLQAAAFIDYAKYGNISGVKACLQLSCSPDVQDPAGSTVLMHAARSGSLPCVQQLLDARSDISMVANDGSTAFHAACEAGHEDVVLALLEEVPGCALFRSDHQGRQPLERLVEQQQSHAAGSADGGGSAEAASHHRAELERMKMATRLRQYSAGRLPSDLDGQELPICYRRAWNERNHCYFPFAFRRMTGLILLHSMRASQTDSGGHMSYLIPPAIWKQVFRFMHRDWVADRAGVCPCCGAMCDDWTLCANCGHKLKPMCGASAD